LSQSQLLNECAFPRCTAANGQPELVEDGVFCQPCKRRYRKMLDWLAMDYVALRELPPLARADDERLGKAARSKEFGHPAEWASDMMRKLAGMLNVIEDGLRDELGHQPAVHPQTAEAVMVRRAHSYLVPHFDQLCTYSAAPDTAEELSDLHRAIRHGLGQTKVVQRLPLRCPWCETAALVRDVGQIDCAACGKTVREELYGWLTGRILDQMLDDYDAAQHAEQPTSEQRSAVTV